MRLILATAIFFALAACSKPTDTVIPSDMSTWEKDLAPAVQKLTDDERRLVTAYLARAKVGEVFGGKGITIGTTIGDAVSEQKKWVAEREAKDAEERALAEKVKADRTRAEAEIRSAVTVTLVEKKEMPADPPARRYSAEQVFRIAVKNNTARELIGVAGELDLLDVFGKRVGVVGFTVSERIKPGQTITWVGSRDYNQFIAEHKAVWNLEEGKYTTRFVPEGLVFADGKKLLLGK